MEALEGLLRRFSLRPGLKLALQGQARLMFGQVVYCSSLGPGLLQALEGQFPQVNLSPVLMLALGVEQSEQQQFELWTFNASVWSTFRKFLEAENFASATVICVQETKLRRQADIDREVNWLTGKGLVGSIRPSCSNCSFWGFQWCGSVGEGRS